MIVLQYFFIFFLLLSVWIIYCLQIKNLPRPSKYRAIIYGSPPYTAGNTSGSPLSELGSHCGFKTVLGKEIAACSALHATITSFGAGRLYDFALCLHGEREEVFFRSPLIRKVHFRPYCIEELSEDRGQLHTRLFFLQHNVAVLEMELEAGEREGKVRPVFFLLPPGGRDLENPYPHLNGYNVFHKKGDGLLLTNYYRLPGLKLQAYFLPSSGHAKGKKELHGPWMEMKPREKKRWSVIVSFSADRENKIVERAERARRRLSSLMNSAEKRWFRFEKKLPLFNEQGDKDALNTFRLAAWALENNLYAPRGKMRRWGSLPSKVYFPFIWGWDTPQHVLGLLEWNPQRAAEVLLTQLEGNDLAPAKARFRLKIKGITVFSGAQKNQIPSKINDSLEGVLNFYSQPPLQSWAALRIYQRFQHPEEAKRFLQKVLPLLRHNVQWWEENRKLSSGLFSYINGLESGLDDSPRFYPRSFLPSFVIGLMPRFLSAVDLNCWLFQSYLNLSYLSREADRMRDVEKYLLRADELMNMIDEKLWSPEDSAWLDRRNGSFVRVFTPVVWWPAFLGTSRNLEKIRKVIERYLLQPDKFWGKYGIPSVSFDDPTYNTHKEGYYWRGQIWMVNNYSALEVLFRYGYTREAAQLHQRIVQTIFRSKGLYETYNAQTGKIGWSSRGPGDPSVLQFGMTSAWMTQVLLYRYQRFCYIFSDTKEVCGHIQWADFFNGASTYTPPGSRTESGKAVLEVQVIGSSAKVPLLFLKSEDGKPLLRSSLLRVRLDEPAGSVGGEGKAILFWRGESYKLRMGKEFRLSLLGQTSKPEYVSELF